MGSCQSTRQAVVGKTTTTSSPKDSLPKFPLHFQYQTNTCALEYYDPIKLLGEGSISSIHLVRKRPRRVKIPYREKGDILEYADKNRPIDPTEPVFALKSIIKKHVHEEAFLQEMRREIHTMSNLNHPNIAKVFEAFERKRHIYLIMEYCAGDNLVDFECTGEWQASVIVRKILSAVAYMHDLNVVHRDIKLENVMFDKDPYTEHGNIKVIDFGLATRYLSSEHKRMTERVGTVYTMAPQVLQGVYDSKCDLWSIGVVAYMLLSRGQQPFWGPSRTMDWKDRKQIMMDRIMRCDYVPMKYGLWDKVSQDAKDFVKTLLKCDPQLRPSARQALQHEWIRRSKSYELWSDPPEDYEILRKSQADTAPPSSSSEEDETDKDPHECACMSRPPSIDVDESAAEVLATPKNTIVPGGTCLFPDCACFVYDANTESIHNTSARNQSHSLSERAERACS